ncbi:mycofactocin system FadH/OYE family oxidoreductase 1 [Streptomyces sp. NPDC048254]|uniref:mycofactocin system FadH/OYE family oxidoreductase 1 n=1 Tax=Streptomyces sp. NPDC048254 TaxID=3365525 RepID=UPI00371B7655
MTLLTDGITLAGRRAPSRVLFGPHPTNLGTTQRELTQRHTAYYERRAAGGAGIVVTETASVTDDDHPYERAPLAARCEQGWAEVGEACHRHGALVLASLGHAGGQGSSAYSQSVLWAPSPFADAASRELPAEMEQEQLDAVVAGFAGAARRTVRAGLDGVELDAGVFALLRQFHSGLTNQRQDGYGTDRLRLTREVVAAVREVIGAGRVLALRLSCDELAPWAGVTPEQAAEQVAELAGVLDLLVVVRGGPFATSAYRPDGHTEPQFNLELCRAMRKAAGGRVPVVLQGSVTEVPAAHAALADGAADLVEMTRAQIAEPRLVELVRAGTPERIRPCVLCNQACQVRDNRNPVVSCIGEPGSGHETEPEHAPRPHASAGAQPVLIVGGGPAGLECARVLASLGHQVRVAERAERAGGMLRAAAVGGAARERLVLLADWLEDECVRLGARILTGTEIGPTELADAEDRGERVVVATGSRPARRAWAAAGVPEALEPVAVRDTPKPVSALNSPEPVPVPDTPEPAFLPDAPEPVPVPDTPEPAFLPDAPEPVSALHSPEHVPVPDTPESASLPDAPRSVSVLDVSVLLSGGPGTLPPDGPVVVDDPVGGPIGVAVAEWLAGTGRQVHLVTQDQVAGVQLARTGDLSDANVRLQRAQVRRELRARLRELRADRVVLEDIWTGGTREVPCVAVVDCGHRLPEETLYHLAKPGTSRAGDCVAPRTVLEAVLEGRRLALRIVSGTGHAPPVPVGRAASKASIPAVASVRSHSR